MNLPPPTAHRIDTWLGAWLFELAAGKKCSAVDVTSSEEVARLVGELREDIAFDPVSTTVFGSAGVFDRVVELHNGDNETSSGFLFHCEDGVFHFVPLQSLTTAAKPSLPNRFRRGVAVLRRRERDEQAALAFWRWRGLVWFAFVASIASAFWLGLNWPDLWH
jgi:hypothetical protein